MPLAVAAFSPKRPKIYPINGEVNVFKDSGYTIIKIINNFTFTFDHGPLGMAPLYNHGHADALSITLSKDDRPILIDPGTYRYNGVPEWRRYFKGTRAHNTVTIDALIRQFRKRVLFGAIHIGVSF